MRHASDASSRSRNQPHTARMLAQAATLDGLLALLLGSECDAAAWQTWVAGPPTASPLCPIRHDHINYAEHDKLEPSSHRVLR